MLVPGWLEEKGLRRFLDGQSSAVLESLLKSVRQGQPPINVGCISSLSASVLSNHDPAVVVENDAGFALFESDGRPRRGVGPALWARFVNSQSDKWQWSSESDIGGFVTLVLEEVARELNLPLEFRTKVGFFKLRPEITVVKAYGVPVGVVAVKRPTKGILDNRTVLGELYDYMKQVVNFYGLKEVFGIVTTYQEWRVCWMENADSVKLAETTPVEDAEESEPQTPVKEAGEKDKTSPVGQTPSKKSFTVHKLDLQGKDEEDTDEEDTVDKVEKDTAERTMKSTRVWSVDENVFNLVGSALWKMNETSMDVSRIGEGQMVIQVTEETFFWCKRPKAAAIDKLQWARVPRAKNVLLLEDLGVGRSGRVWLVCSASGLVGVLKFSVVTGMGERLEDLRKKHVETELEGWKEIYPDLGKMCRVQKFAGHWALLMPHLCAPKRNEASVNRIEQTLRKHFVEKNLKHEDVAWRNIGMYRDEAGHDVCIVLDLERVTTSKSGDWVNDAIAELREKANLRK